MPAESLKASEAPALMRITVLATGAGAAAGLAVKAGAVATTGWDAEADGAALPAVWVLLDWQPTTRDTSAVKTPIWKAWIEVFLIIDN